MSTGFPGGRPDMETSAGAKTCRCPLRNLAIIPDDLRYRVQITGYDDQGPVLEGGTTLPRKRRPSVPLTWQMDTSAWPLGPYDGDIEVFSPSAPQRHRGPAANPSRRH